MSFFAVVFKVIPYLWPFIKEMLIGKKSWKQAFRENRSKTILVVSLALSLTFNVVLMTKVGHLAYNYLALSRAKQELEIKYKELDKVKTGNVSSHQLPRAANVEVVTEIPKETKVDKGTHTKQVVVTDAILAEELRVEAERIRQREAAGH